MLDSQQKRKINKILYHWVTLAVLFVAILFVARSTWFVYQKKLESENLKNISLEYKNKLEEREKALDLQIERLNTESGKEAEIRSKFSVAKENENTVVIVEEKPPEKATTSPKNFWQKLLDLFTN